MRALGRFGGIVGAIAGACIGDHTDHLKHRYFSESGACGGRLLGGFFDTGQALLRIRFGACARRKLAAVTGATSSGAAEAAVAALMTMNSTDFRIQLRGRRRSTLSLGEPRS
jgi:hypothetical protein